MLGKMEVAFEEDWECMCKNQGFLLARNGEGGLVKEADGFKVASKGPPPAQKVPAVNKLKMLTVREGGGAGTACMDAVVLSSTN